MKTEITISKDKMGCVFFEDARYPHTQGFIQSEDDIKSFFEDIALPTDEQDHISRGYTYRGDCLAVDCLDDYLYLNLNCYNLMFPLEHFAPRCMAHGIRMKRKEPPHGMHPYKYEYECDKCQCTNTIINPEDYQVNFWGTYWRLTLDSCWKEFYIVNGNYEQGCVDLLIDWCEEYAPGLLWEHEEVNERIREDGENALEDWPFGGNHCRYMNTKVRIEKIVKETNNANK